MNIYSFRKESDNGGNSLIMRSYEGNLEDMRVFENIARQISEDQLATFYLISPSMPNYDSRLLMKLEEDHREIYCLREYRGSLGKAMTLDITDIFYVKRIYMRELLIGCNNIDDVIQRIVMEAIYGKVFRSTYDYRIKDVPNGEHFIFVLVGTGELIEFDDHSKKKYHHPDLDILSSEEEYLSVFDVICIIVVFVIIIVALLIIANLHGSVSSKEKVSQVRREC